MSPLCAGHDRLAGHQRGFLRWRGLHHDDGCANGDGSDNVANPAKEQEHAAGLVVVEEEAKAKPWEVQGQEPGAQREGRSPH